MVTGIVLLFVIIYFLHIIEPHCHGLHGPPGVVSMSIRDIIGFKPLLKKKKKHLSAACQTGLSQAAVSQPVPVMAYNQGAGEHAGVNP